MMKKSIFILFIFFGCISCTPSIYQVYEQYEGDPKFEHTTVNVEFLKMANFLIPKKQKSTKALLDAIQSVDIIRYQKGNSDSEFQKKLLKSFLHGGYKEVKIDGVEKKRFFMKKGMTRVREFHVLDITDERVSVFSISGTFNFSDLYTVYNLIKKQEGVTNFMNNFDYQIKN